MDEIIKNKCREEMLSIIENEIKSLMDKAGIYYRVFGRVKSTESIKHKLKTHIGQYNENKKMQDLLGVRIVFYFQDDIDIIKQFMKYHFAYTYDSESTTISDINIAEGIVNNIDGLHDKLFMPTRLNVIFKAERELKDKYDELFNELKNDNINTKLIDYTFEVQFRSVLSEGWHEVEHDLRYKCKEDWAEMQHESRILNGIHASLETCEHSMSMLLASTAKKYQKMENWDAMVRNIVRLKLKDYKISSEVRSYFNRRFNLIDAVTNLDREKLLYALLLSKPVIELTADNIILLIYSLAPKKNRNNDIIAIANKRSEGIMNLNANIPPIHKMIRENKREENKLHLLEENLSIKEATPTYPYTIMEIRGKMDKLSKDAFLRLYIENRLKADVLLDITNVVDANSSYEILGKLIAHILTQEKYKSLNVNLRISPINSWESISAIQNYLRANLESVIKGIRKSSKVPHTVPDVLISKHKTNDFYIVSLSDRLYY